MEVTLLEQFDGLALLLTFLAGGGAVFARYAMRRHYAERDRRRTPPVTRTPDWNWPTWSGGKR